MKRKTKYWGSSSWLNKLKSNYNVTNLWSKRATNPIKTPRKTRPCNKFESIHLASNQFVAFIVF
jgi:hypothetical protein